MTREREWDEREKWIAQLEKEREEHGEVLSASHDEPVEFRPRPGAKALFTFRLDKETLGEVIRLAHENNTTPSDVVRQFVERGLEARESSETKDRLDRVERSINELRERQATYEADMPRSES